MSWLSMAFSAVEIALSCLSAFKISSESWPPIMDVNTWDTNPIRLERTLMDEYGPHIQQLLWMGMKDKRLTIIMGRSWFNNK